jgi:hypothetical protein
VLMTAGRRCVTTEDNSFVHQGSIRELRCVRTQESQPSLAQPSGSADEASGQEAAAAMPPLMDLKFVQPEGLPAVDPRLQTDAATVQPQQPLSHTVSASAGEDNQRACPVMRLNEQPIREACKNNPDESCTKYGGKLPCCCCALSGRRDSAPASGNVVVPREETQVIDWLFISADALFYCLHVDFRCLPELSNQLVPQLVAVDPPFSSAAEIQETAMRCFPAQIPVLAPLVPELPSLLSCDLQAVLNNIDLTKFETLRTPQNAHLFDEAAELFQEVNGTFRIRGLASGVSCRGFRWAERGRTVYEYM